MHSFFQLLSFFGIVLEVLVPKWNKKITVKIYEVNGGLQKLVCWDGRLDSLRILGAGLHIIWLEAHTYVAHIQRYPHFPLPLNEQALPLYYFIFCALGYL